MFLLPVILFLTNSPEILEESIVSAGEVGVDFILFGGMMLKDGGQKNYIRNP